MKQHGDAALIVERTFAATPQAAFDAWTNPDVLATWMHAHPSWTTPEAQVDLRIGGCFRVVMREPGGKDHGGRGEFVEIDRPARLAYTWAWDREPDMNTIVEIEFIACERGTTVRLTHRLLPSPESRDGHRSGWTNLLASLERRLARWSSVHLPDLENVAPAGSGHSMHPATIALASAQLGASFHRFEPNTRQGIGHRHESAELEEFYVVTSGDGRIAIGDEIVAVRPLDTFRIPAGTLRAFEAGIDGLEVVAFGPRSFGEAEIVPGYWPAP